MSAFYKTFLLSGLASGAVLTAIWIGFLGYEAIKLIRLARSQSFGRDHRQPEHQDHGGWRPARL